MRTFLITFTAAVFFSGFHLPVELWEKQKKASETKAYLTKRQGKLPFLLKKSSFPTTFTEKILKAKVATGLLLLLSMLVAKMWGTHIKDSSFLRRAVGEEEQN